MASHRPLFPSGSKVRLLANPELGAKQICPNCQSKFYDLGRRPAVCPKCGESFDPEEAQRQTDKAVRIIQATEAGDLLPRAFAAADHFECRFCPFSGRCWK